MKFRTTLGKTDLQVQRIGLGTWPLSGNAYGPVEEKLAAHIIQEAIDQGVNFFDTADVYGNGHCESLLAKAIQGKRDGITIATKVGWDFYHGLIRANYDPAYMRFALEESLRRLSTPYIDLYQLHNPPVRLMKEGQMMALLEDFRREGKIRYWGVSVHGPEEGLRWLEQDKMDTLQIVLNMIDQRPLDRLFPEAQKKNVGLIVREPLACGMLGGKYKTDHDFSKKDHRRRWPRTKMDLDLKKIKVIEDALSIQSVPLAQLAIEFCLHFDAVSVVIPGAKTLEQLRMNLKPLQEIHLESNCIARVRECYLKDSLFREGFYRN